MGKKLPENTKKAIAEAKAKKKSDKKLNKTEQLLLFMADGKWHEASELAYGVSWRFGGYLHELKKRGVEWEKQRLHEIKDSVVYKYRLCKED